MKYMGTDRDKD